MLHRRFLMSAILIDSNNIPPSCDSFCGQDCAYECDTYSPSYPTCEPYSPCYSDCYSEGCYDCYSDDWFCELFCDYDICGGVDFDGDGCEIHSCPNDGGECTYHCINDYDGDGFEDNDF